jgi:subtilase family serine protease
MPSLRLLTAATMGLAVAVGATPMALSASSAGVARPTAVKDEVVCKHAGTARARCFAIRVDHLMRGRVHHEVTPIGYGPSDLQAAYGLPASSASDGGTVGIVDAYDDPTAEADLAVYRAYYGLPACTSATGCFRKIDQRGGGDYPDADPGWAEEESLDLDMVSAACPRCRILLVESDSASMANLGAAVDEAVAEGAAAVSNSYGGPDAKDSTYGRYYHHTGVAVTASAGDNGYGVSYPASSKWVTAVGGTTLRRSSSSRGFTETAWSGSGSGCSTLNLATWRSPDITSCPGRAVADVSAVADPATGVAVFDSTPYEQAVGWLTFGGTSASSPIIAAVFALAGNTSSVSDGSYLWSHESATALWDVTSGSNGTCPTSRWCTAGSGWDGPTGWGTPHGLAAF